MKKKSINKMIGSFSPKLMSDVFSRNLKKNMQWGVYDGFGVIVTVFKNKKDADNYVNKMSKDSGFFVSEVEVVK